MWRAAQIFAVACGLVAPGGPAAAQVVQDAQFWLNTTVFVNADDFAFFAEAQPRFGDGISRLDQFLLRPAIGWQIATRLTLLQGYAYVETPQRIGRADIEDRSFQQLNWDLGDVAGGNLSSRTRLEQRWLSTGQDLGWRLREFLRYARPLADGGDVKSDLAAVGWVEGFFHLNATDWGARTGLERVRTFVGLQVPLQGRSTLEVGYINQVVATPAPGTPVDHILSLNVLLRY